MKKPILIDYSKSTKQEAMRVFPTASLTLIGLGTGFALLGRAISLSWFEVLAIGSIILILFGVAFAYCVVNFWSDSDFRCVVTNEKITCNSPAPGCGESFSLKIAEISEIEREPWGEHSERYFLRDLKGNRYWLTSNYDNPIQEILAALKSVNPKILGC